MMYQVSDRCRKQFEKMLGIESVKAALKFIEEDQNQTIEDQKELSRPAWTLCLWEQPGKKEWEVLAV